MKVTIAIIYLATSIINGRSCSDGPPSSGSCIRSNDSRGIPYEEIGGRGVQRFPSNSQAIATSYRFTCCGRVTQWGSFVEPGGRNEDEKYDITFQVWRPTSSSASGECFHLVGENVFSNIALGGGGEVCESPPTDQQIMVQPGDVVGFYQSHDDGGNRGIQIHQGYSQESVWYQINPQPSTDQECTYAVGPNGALQTFTEHAPVLAVTIEQFQCPSVTSAPSEETTSLEETVTTMELFQPTDANISTITESRLGSRISSTSGLETEQPSATSQPHTSTSIQGLEFSSNLPRAAGSTPPPPRDATDLNKPLETTTTIKEATVSDNRYRYALIASIATGTAAAIFLALLTATCILLLIAAAKNKKLKRGKLRERLDNSLMYNDMYMELSKARQRDSRTSSNEDSSCNSSFNIPPTLPRSHPPQAARQNSRYILSTNPAVDVLPPRNQDHPDSSHYMVPGAIVPKATSHAQLHVGGGSQVMPCYAVAGSSYNSQEDGRLVKTASNVAYNAIHTC